MKIQEETDVKEYQIRKKKSREQTVIWKIKKRQSERQSWRPQRKKMNMLKKWECFRLIDVGIIRSSYSRSSAK